MRAKYPELGRFLRELRDKSGFKQLQIMANLPVEQGDRDLRRWEAGNRPSRQLLIQLLVYGIQIDDVKTINKALDLAEYFPLKPPESKQHGLGRSITKKIMNSYEPQQVRWGPTVGLPPGILCRSVSSPETKAFVPLAELKGEIEQRLLNQLRLHIPRNCRIVIEAYRGEPNWLGRIRDATGAHIGDLWFGTDPDNHWRYDGLVRVGKEISDNQCVVWQVFQRYSDGTYARLRIQEQKSA
jgi:hypothetical protein